MTSDLDTLFEEHEKIMQIKARVFKERYYADYDELIGQGHLIFMRAVNTYKPEFGKFSNWFGFLLGKIWLEHIRRRAMRNARLRQTHMEMMRVKQPIKPYFDAKGFLAELSDDAQKVVKLIIEPSPNIELGIAERNSDSPKSVRAAVKEHLRDLGWTWRRIKESFQEVSRALQS